LYEKLTVKLATNYDPATEAKINKMIKWNKIDGIDTLKKHLANLEDDGQISLYKSNVETFQTKTYELNVEIKRHLDSIKGYVNHVDAIVETIQTVLSLRSNHRKSIHKKYFYTIGKYEEFTVLCCFRFDLSPKNDQYPLVNFFSGGKATMSMEIYFGLFKVLDYKEPESDVPGLYFGPKTVKLATSYDMDTEAKINKMIKWNKIDGIYTLKKHLANSDDRKMSLYKSNVKKQLDSIKCFVNHIDAIVELFSEYLIVSS